jgi:transposase
VLNSTSYATSSTPRRRGDRASWEIRRLEAGKLFRKGLTQAEVVRRLGANQQSVSRWYHQWKEGGMAALRSSASVGRPPLTTERQLQAVERALLKGPVANGFPNELWTLPRVVVVVERITGVTYSPGHAWKLMRRLGWTRQRPARRASARNDEQIAHWVKTEWPRIKKTPDGVRPGSSSRMRAGSR